MQGFNRFYPSDYDPKNPQHKGNLNRLAGKAAQKPVVRFEMPYNVWCLGCDSHIAQGVRFNAHKQKTGNYLSSPIYTFSMKCHICATSIVIATNPKDTCYEVVSGAKKKAEEWNAQENGTFEFNVGSMTAEDEDPIYKLEKDATQKVNLKDAEEHVTQLLRENDRQWKDPYTQSQRLRRSFRSQKTVLRAADKVKADLQNRHGLGLDILDQNTSDQIAAKSVDYERRPQKALLGTIRSTTMDKNDPFNTPLPESKRQRKSESEQVVLGMGDDAAQSGAASGKLVDYGSDG